MLPGPPQQSAEPGRVNSDFYSAILLAFVFFVHHLEKHSFESDPNYIVPLVIVVVWTIVLYIERFLKLYLSYCYRSWCEWALRMELYRFVEEENMENTQVRLTADTVDVYS